MVNNFIVEGTDGKTPAMRLGFAQRPYSYEDILLDGERIPQPKRVRRKGKSTLKLPRVAALGILLHWRYQIDRVSPNVSCV